MVWMLKNKQFKQTLKELKHIKVNSNQTSKSIIFKGGKYTIAGDIFLLERIFPTLFGAFEELSEEVETLIIRRGEKHPEEKNRFNPILFIGQYLMRNNPLFKGKEQFDNIGYQRFQKYLDKKKRRRFFRIHRNLLKRLFKSCNGGKK